MSKRFYRGRAICDRSGVDWKDRDVRAAYLANRRTRSLPGSCTAEDIRNIRVMQDNKCVYCKIDLGKYGELDHIVAVAKGGSSHPSNLQWLCRPCNGLKCDHSHDEFIKFLSTGSFKDNLICIEGPTKEEIYWLGYDAGRKSPNYLYNYGKYCKHKYYVRGWGDGSEGEPNPKMLPRLSS